MRRINPDHPLTQTERNRRFYENHKESERKRNRQYCQDNKEKVAQRRRNYRHGINQEWFDSKVQEQNNRCAVCHKEFTETPHIDHKHSCCPKLKSCDKCRRGLLCAPCNVMIGMAQESIEVLQNAIQYVQQYKV